MIVSLKGIPRLRRNLKGKKVVFVSGCFDIVHKGHIQFLEKAASYGDVLVVGVLSDKYIRLKKHREPALKQHERAVVIQALKPVGHVICTKYKNGKGPSVEVLRMLRPTVFLKREKRHGPLAYQDALRALGVQLKSHPIPKANSSSRIVRRLKNRR